jgi:hypothetical protein
LSNDISVRLIFKELRNLHKRWVTFALASALFGLTGCNGDNQNAGKDTGNRVGMNNINNNINNDNNGITGRNVSTGNARETRAINNVERLREVDQAHVAIYNNVAWVTVRLNRGEQGTTGDQTGTRNGTRTNNDGTANNNNGPANTGTTNGGQSGTYGAGTDRANDGTTGTGTNAGYNNDGTGGFNANNTLAGSGAERINRYAKDNSGDGQNGRMGNTGNSINDNNWAGGTDFREPTTRLEQRIADQVRITDKRINKVYISYQQ